MAQQSNVLDVVREGNRWIHGRPSAEDVASWFAGNVRIHEGLEHEHYIGGLVMIGQTESYKEGRLQGNGEPTVVELERVVFTPYAKVETRIAYFWDWLRHEREYTEKDLVGKIEPATDKELLPGFPGSFRYTVNGRTSGGGNADKHYIGCSMRVRVYERDARSGHEGKLYFESAPGSKVVPVLTRNGWADDNAVMKAQTGAVGRALGMAGMLVIPGSGVATAEDVQEAISGASLEAPASTEPTLPPPPPAPEEPAEPADLREEIVKMLEQLEAHPDSLEQIRSWAQERNLSLSELRDSQLRGVHRQVSRKLAEAQTQPEA